MLRWKPEIMKNTGEMSEKKYSINNGLLTARKEVSSTRFPRTQTYSGSIFTLQRRQENVAVSKNIGTLSRNILSNLKAKRGRGERGKKIGIRALIKLATRKIRIS